MPSFTVSEFIQLKTLRLTDAPDLFHLVECNRAYLRHWLPWLDVNTAVEDSEQFIQSTLEQLAENNGFQCGIFYRDQLVGMCGYHPINWANSTASLGYWLAENMMGKGIVTCCTKYLIDYAFEQLSLNKVCIVAAEKNHKSRTVAERLGLTKDYIEPDAENLYGQYVDHMHYSISRADWELL